MSLDWQGFLAQVNVALELMCISRVLANGIKPGLFNAGLAAVLEPMLAISPNRQLSIILTS
jgi:hypothetical protein